MASDLKTGTLWTPPAFTDDGSHNNQSGYIAANGSYGLNPITAEILAAQQAVVNHRGSTVANVRDYGATGNGSTDDTNAIKAAVATGKRIIYFPPGTYRITSNVALTEQIILGAGRSWSEPTAGDNSLSTSQIVANGNFTIFTFSGNANGMYGINSRGFSGSETHVQIGEGSNGFVTECWFSGPGTGTSTAIYGTGIVQGYMFTNLTTDGICNGVHLDQPYNCHFIGCRIYGGGTGTVAGIAFHGGGGNIIADSVIDFFPRGVTAGSPSTTKGGISLTGGYSCRIIGCDINNCDTGVMVSGSAVDTTISSDFHSNGGDDILVTGTKRVLVTGSNFGKMSSNAPARARGTATAGVRTSGTCSRVAVVGNMASGEATYRTLGVVLSSATTLSVVDNLVHEGLTTPTTDGNGGNTIGTVVG